METITISGLRRLHSDGQLRMLRDLMLHRREQFDRLGELPSSEGPIHLVVDEATLLLQENREAVAIMEDLARFGRKLGVTAELHTEGATLGCVGGSPLIRDSGTVAILPAR